MWTLGTIALFLSLVSLTGAELIFRGKWIDTYVTLTCIPADLTCTSVQIKKGNQILQSSQIKEHNHDAWTHTINNVGCANGGVYTCSCTQNDGNVLTANHKILVLDPADRTFKFQESDGSFSITCSVLKKFCKNPTLSKGNQVLKGRSVIEGSHSKLTYTNNNPTCADVKRYKCLCNNDKGHDVVLTRDLKSYQIGSNLQFTKTLTNGKISLSCSAPQGECKNVEISTRSEVGRLTKTVKNNRDIWTYIIDNPQCHRSGAYDCWCTTKTNRLLKKTYTLNVAGLRSKPCVRFYPACTNADLVLKCLILNGRCSKVEILKGNQPLQVTHKSLWVYTKRNPTLQDDGVYTCKCTMDSGVVHTATRTVSVLRGCGTLKTKVMATKVCPPNTVQHIPEIRFKTATACSPK